MVRMADFLDEGWAGGSVRYNAPNTAVGPLCPNPTAPTSAAAERGDHEGVMPMSNFAPDKPSVIFERSPVPGVPVEVIRFLLTLPDEVRIWLGNFLLSSTAEGFDGTPETSAWLWKEELQRRLDHATAHPESLLSADQTLQHVKEHLEQLRRTPRSDHLVGYHCIDYFGDGWAETGHFDEVSQFWVVEPLSNLSYEQRHGFFAIGGPGFDGIKFCYRYGHHGLWAFYPSEEWKYLAATVAELVEGWCSGKISV
jgi:hypothetical protein